MPRRTWIEIRVEVPGHIQEEVGLFLTEWSGRGVILEDASPDSGPGGSTGVRVYFPAAHFGPNQHVELQQYLQRLESMGYQLGQVVMQEVPEEDWAHAWQAHFKPRKLTRRIVIRPPWGDYRPRSDELVLTIYPGMAFGTGRHPTTRLCLQALEEILDKWPGPNLSDFWQALDVGAGTGILSLAAARLGAKVLAIDVDPEALAAVRKNILLNHLQDQVRADDIPLVSIRRQFDLILANLTGPDLLSLADPLAGRLRTGGWLIISGFLQDEVPRLMADFVALGLKMTRTHTREDWVALVFTRS